MILPAEYLTFFSEYNGFVCFCHRYHTCQASDFITAEINGFLNLGVHTFMYSVSVSVKARNLSLLALMIERNAFYSAVKNLQNFID
jgi:hypothetical protein